MHAQVQLAPAIVDDQRIEQAERVHADQHGGLLGHLPVLEDAHVRECHVAGLDLDRPELDRWRAPSFAGLDIVRDALHLIDRRVFARGMTD